MPKKTTQEDYLKICENKFGNKFDLSKVVYTNTNTKIIIGCPDHGEVTVSAGQFKRSKYGCPYCGGTKNLTQEMFSKLIPEKHKQEYDLSKILYETRQSYITVGCKLHGDFDIIADNFVIGQGCPKCRYIKSANSKRGNIEDILESFREIHNDKYKYEQIEPYESRLKTRIKIICPNHGDFIQPIDRHYNGHGCPTCSSSKGELLVEKILIKHNIIYEKEKVFLDCRNHLTNKPLRFDFYLSEINVCIEYNGRQHYEEIPDFFDPLEDTQYRDKIKEDYCESKNIDLIIIKFDEADEFFVNRIIKQLNN